MPLSLGEEGTVGFDQHLPVAERFHDAMRSTMAPVNMETPQIAIVGSVEKNEHNNTADHGLRRIEEALNETWSRSRAREMRDEAKRDCRELEGPVSRVLRARKEREAALRSEPPVPVPKDEVEGIMQYLASQRHATQARRAELHARKKAAIDPDHAEKTNVYLPHEEKQWASKAIEDLFKSNQNQRAELEKRVLYKEYFKNTEPESIPLVWTTHGRESTAEAREGYLSPYPDDKPVPRIGDSAVQDSLTVEYYRQCLDSIPRVPQTTSALGLLLYTHTP